MKDFLLFGILVLSLVCRKEDLLFIILHLKKIDNKRDMS